MRFRTTQMEEHNTNKIAFGRTQANPKTIFEEMARQSRRKMNYDGKPNTLLAHEEERRTGNVWG